MSSHTDPISLRLMSFAADLEGKYGLTGDLVREAAGLIGIIRDDLMERFGADPDLSTFDMYRNHVRYVESIEPDAFTHRAKCTRVGYEDCDTCVCSHPFEWHTIQCEGAECGCSTFDRDLRGLDSPEQETGEDSLFGGSWEQHARLAAGEERNI